MEPRRPGPRPRAMSACLVRRPAPVRLPAIVVLAALIALVAAACTGPPGSATSGMPTGSGISTGPTPPATTSGVDGAVTAGPVCPVERPGDSACSPGPVAGAVLVVKDATGAEAGSVTTDASGLYRLELPPGSYTLVPQPVAGLMGTPAPQPFTVASGRLTRVNVSYDTGIR